MTLGERDHLVMLYERLESVKIDLKDAIAAVAEKRGYQPATIRKYVVALVRDQAEQTREDAQQLLDLLDAEAEGLADVKIEITAAAAQRPKEGFTSPHHGGITGYIQ